MIGTSWWQYVFARACIVFLQYIIPLGSLCCIILFSLGLYRHKIPIVVLVWAALETVFFLLVFMPRYFSLQQKALHPPPLPRHERQELFKLCVESVFDPERYLSKWFRGAPASEIRRENVKQFFCWSFLNKDDYGLLDDDELEDYADQTEKMLGRKLPQGTGNAVALRLTLDRVQMLHRPLIWYLVSSSGLEVEMPHPVRS